MKYTISLVFIAFILSCQPKQKEQLDIPWFAKERIKNDRVFSYNYKDSLQKYQVYQEKRIDNLGNYYSYLSNLNFIVNPTQEKEAIQLLEKSIQLDSIAFCNHLILESYQYLKPNGRPYRRYTMPFILDLDLEYFINRLKDCQAINQQPDFVFDQEKELMLHMHFILLKDQWFRIPSKKANNEKQIQYDIENRKSLDDLFDKFDFPNDNDDLKDNIFTLILHSTDCDWTLKWINIYMEKYRGYDKYEKHLNHFLWRSTCTNSEMKNLVQEELNKNKN